MPSTVQLVGLSMPAGPVAIMAFVVAPHRPPTDENISAEIARTGLPTPLYWRRIDPEDVPADRTHRDAWRMSANGGPIWVDETIAQRIDEARMWALHERNRA